MSEQNTDQPVSLFALLTALADAGDPEATIATDSDGQVIIYTNLRQDPTDSSGDQLIHFED